MSVTTNSQSFIVTDSTPAYQNWESINPIHFVYLMDQASAINPAIINLKIKDLTPVEIASYSSFRYKAKKEYIDNTSNIDWLLANSTKLASLINTTPVTVAITPYNQSDSLTFSIQNLSLMLDGNYKAKVIFSIEGFTNGSWVEISSYEELINFDIYEDEQITWENTPFVVNHVYENPVFGYTEFVMKGPSWKVFSNNNNNILSCDDVDVIFGSDANGNWLTGSGTKTIKMSSSAFYNTPSGLSGSPFANTLWVIAGDTTFIGFISYQMIVVDTALFANPTTLNFEATKGGNEPLPQEIDVYAEHAYTINSPAWLSVTTLTESAPGIPNKLSVVPIPYNNLDGGTYTGIITLNGTDGVNPITIDINVEYLLNDFVSSNYQNNSINFSLEPELIEFYTTIPDTYFELNVKIKAFDYVYQSPTYNEVSIPLKVPLFNKQQAINIGNLIEKVFFKFKNPILNSTNQYNAALVTLEIKEKKYPSNELLRELTISNMKFLSGLKPTIKIDNNAFLEISEGVKRVTSKSFDYINMMLELGTDKEVEIFKNGTSVLTKLLQPLNDTFKDVINFEILEAKPGDVFIYKVWLDTAKTKSIEKKYLVFPETEYSTMIIWEDEYRMLQTFEFTGKFLIKKDYEAIQFKRFDEVIEKTEIIKSINSQKVSINTGFVSKNDIIFIDGIISAKRCWVKSSSDKLIELISTTKSIIPQDIDRELISFDLDFEINKKYNEENNSF